MRRIGLLVGLLAGTLLWTPPAARSAEIAVATDSVDPVVFAATTAGAQLAQSAAAPLPKNPFAPEPDQGKPAPPPPPPGQPADKTAELPAIKSPEPPAAKGAEEPGAKAADEPGGKAAEEPSEKTAPPANEPQTPSPDLLASRAADRIADVPNMFGDSYFGAIARLINSGKYPCGAHVDAALPLAGADRVGKIAEDDNVMPHERVFVLYNHFAHALEVNSAVLDNEVVSPVYRAFDIDRYTIGFEQTFCDDRWSVGLRIPFFGATDFSPPGSFVTFNGTQVGNLAVNIKRLVYRGDTTATCVGLGIDTPTGGDLNAHAFDADLVIRNDAFHLMPFAGLLGAPNDRFFYQAFLQIDVPTNADRVSYTSRPLGPDVNICARYNDPALLYADLEAGYWFYRNRCADVLTGLASVLEFHYTAMLQHGNRVDLLTNRGDETYLGNPANHPDVVNITFGLHAELARHTLVRVAGVVPLTNSDNRGFDGEVQVQLDRRF